MKDDDYEPATGKDQENIRFERNEAGYEQSIFGGNAMDIEKSILEDTYTNSRMIGKTIQGVDTEKLGLGAGHLVRLVLNFHDGTRVAIRAEGDTLVIEANG